jgi:hypothetical protein
MRHPYDLALYHTLIRMEFDIFFVSCVCRRHRLSNHVCGLINELKKRDRELKNNFQGSQGHTRCALELRDIMRVHQHELLKQTGAQHMYTHHNPLGIAPRIFHHISDGELDDTEHANNKKVIINFQRNTKNECVCRFFLILSTARNGKGKRRLFAHFERNINELFALEREIANHMGI